MNRRDRLPALVVLLALFAAASPARAQESEPVVVKLDPAQIATLEDHLDQPLPGSFSLAHFPMPDGTRRGVRFEPLVLWSPAASIEVLQDGVVTDVLAPPVGTQLAGAIPGAPRAFVHLRRDAEGGFAGSLRLDGTDYRVASQPDLAANLVFTEEPEPPPGSFACGVDDLAGAGAAGGSGAGTTGSGLAASGPIVHAGHLGAEIAFETDYELYDATVQNGYGGSIPDVERVPVYLNDLLAIVNLAFQRDLQTSLRIAYVAVRSDPADPWTESEHAPALDEFRAFWLANRGGVHRDHAHFLSGKTRPSGPASRTGITQLTGAVCDLPNAFSTSNILAGTEVFGATVLAHELGHGLGASHTHAFGSASGFDEDPEPIDLCDNGAYPERPAVQTRGTIMSYCNQREFRFHPRNQVRVRDVVERAACLDPLPWPAIEPIADHEQKRGLAASEGYARLFSFDVPGGAIELRATSGCGWGNADLVLLDGPSLVAESRGPDNDESIVLVDPGAGTRHIRLEAAQTFSGACLRVATRRNLPSGYAEHGIEAMELDPLGLGVFLPDNSRTFAIDVPPGALDLRFETSSTPVGSEDGTCGFVGDADLFASFGAPPTSALPLGHDYASRTASCNAEVIEVPAPTPGRWWVTVWAARSFSQLSLRASVAEEQPIGGQATTTIGKLGASSGDSFRFYATIPSGVQDLEIEVGEASGTPAFLDLFARLGARASAADHDLAGFWPAFPTVGEASPAGGTWHWTIDPVGADALATTRARFSLPDVRPLGNRVPESGLAAGPGVPLLYVLSVPPGVPELVITSQPGSGDADLYVAHGPEGASPPPPHARLAPASFPAAWPFSSVTPGSAGEGVVIPAPDPGLYWILLHPASAYAGVTLSGTWNRPPVFVPIPGFPDPVWVPSPGYLGELVPFAVSAADPDGDALDYAWDFGDGSAPGSGDEPSHVYTAPGSYTVTVSASDGLAPPIQESRTLQITDPNRAPVVQDILLPPVIRAQRIASLAVETSDPDGDPVTMEWDFGDGSVGAGKIVDHVWSSPGPVTVSVTVRDFRGGVATDQRVVDVKPRGRRCGLLGLEGPALLLLVRLVRRRRLG